MDENRPAIRIDGLRFRYREGGFELRIPALALEPGASAAVVGPSGCGKTTLLHLVAGIVPPGAGRIEVDGVEVSGLPEARRREFRITRLGLVFQEFELLDHLHVLDNVLLPYRLSAALRLDGAVRERAAALVERVGLGGKQRRSVRRLSQGERQRVGVCRALLTGPSVLLADEPTGNLDPANKSRVLDILFEHARETGATLLTVTHDRDVTGRFDRTLDVKDWGRE